MHEEDTVAHLRAQVRAAQDHYAAMVRLEEQYPQKDWLSDGVDRAATALFSAQQALQAALESSPPPPPAVVVASAPVETPAPDPATLTWAKQARFHTCAHFRSELEQALVWLRDQPDGAFTRETIAHALGKCSADTLDNYCKACQVDLRAEIPRVQRSGGNSSSTENFG